MSFSLTRKAASRLLAAGLLGSAALASACAHSNGSQGAGVRLAATDSEVSGCERVSGVKVIGASTRADAQKELERLTRDRGGNVLLVPGSSDGMSGTAYRCSDSAATAAASN